MNEHINLNWLWATLTAAGSSLVTWIFTRRKQNAEAAGNELENIEKAVAIWRQIASDLEGKFNALQTEVLEVRKKVIQLELENERLENTNSKLQGEIDELRKKIKP